MMLLETTMLDIITTVMIVFQVLVCLLLILVVMMQRPKQEGLGAAFGGDTMDSLTGAHATDFLQKGTAILGTILFVLTFAVSMLVIAGADHENKTSVNDSVTAPEIEASPEDEAEIEEALNSVSDELEEAAEETDTPVAEVPDAEESSEPAEEPESNE